MKGLFSPNPRRLAQVPDVYVLDTQRAHARKEEGKGEGPSRYLVHERPFGFSFHASIFQPLERLLVSQIALGAWPALYMTPPSLYH